MTTSTLLLLAFGLAMDAFAVSLTNGMCYRIKLWKNALSSGLAFGVFQAVMPLVGYLAGHAFSDVIQAIDHWVALGLLSLIGGKMIVDACRDLRRPEGAPPSKTFSLHTLSLQAVATSIDALAVGVGLGVMQVDLLAAVGTIGLVTFLCSFCGVLIGKTVGGALKDKAEILGGVILIIIGIKIFAEHSGLF